MEYDPIEARLPRHKRRYSQQILPTDWRLGVCVQSTGEDCLEDWGPESLMRASMQRQAARGRDVWLTAPDGTKHLPNTPMVATDIREQQDREGNTYVSYLPKQAAQLHQADDASVIEHVDRIVATPSAHTTTPAYYARKRMLAGAAGFLFAGVLIGRCIGGLGHTCQFVAYWVAVAGIGVSCIWLQRINDLEARNEKTPPK